MIKKIYFFSLILLIIGVLSACSLWQKTPTLEPIEPEEKEEPETSLLDDNKFLDFKTSSSIEKFADYDEFANFISKLDTSGSYYYDTMRSFDAPIAMSEGVASDAFSIESQKVYSDDFSETNIQVEGVDEADIVKTDGKYIYLLARNHLFIVDAYPAENMEIISELKFNSIPSDMYLYDEKIIVIGHDNVVDKVNFNRRYSSFTFLKVYDIKDPKNPIEIKASSFEGYYNSSRLIAGNLYLILNNNIRKSDDPIDMVPILIENDQLISSDCSSFDNCFAPDIYYFDYNYSSYNLTSINTINLDEDVKLLSSQSYLLGSGQTIYVSLDNIYITFPHQVRNFESFFMDLVGEFIYERLSEDDKDLIEEIYSVSDRILNEFEKQRKLQEVYERYITDENEKEVQEELRIFISNNINQLSDEIEKTFIHRFSLDNTVPEHRAEGFVPGYVLNQFSIDESFDSNLRIATTNNNNHLRHLIDFDNPLAHEEFLSFSNLFVLSPDLEIIGSVRNIAPDERIYSARFMGDRAYLVTFKEIDPFFVIDLKDPRNPKVLGELKIPGFSTYLHPYDENTIIGLGYDTSLGSWGGVITEGVKLALFDVSDPENPIELDSFIAGETGSQSFALYNHKAFLFSHHKNLLLLPVYLRNYEYDGNKQDFAGALVFSIEDKKFNLRGKINHADENESSQTNWWCGSRCYSNSVQRGLYIDDIIYTFSINKLKANDLINLEKLNSIELFSYLNNEVIVDPIPIPMPRIDNFR